MEETFLISAMSLFAGASLVPAGFLILRDRDIPINRQHHVKGGMATLMGFVLLCIGAMFLLNTVAQDTILLLVLVGLLIILPLGIIWVDKQVNQKPQSGL